MQLSYVSGHLRQVGYLYNITTLECINIKVSVELYFNKCTTFTETLRVTMMMMMMMLYKVLSQHIINSESAE